MNEPFIYSEKTPALDKRRCLGITTGGKKVLYDVALKTKLPTEKELGEMIHNMEAQRAILEKELHERKISASSYEEKVKKLIHDMTYEKSRLEKIKNMKSLGRLKENGFLGYEYPQTEKRA
jgi:enoyl reductase-like protein